MGSLPLSLSSVQGFAYKGQLKRGIWSTCIQRFLDLTKCCFAFRSSSVMLYCLTDCLFVCLFVCLLPCAKWHSSWLCIQLASRLIPAFLSPQPTLPFLELFTLPRRRLLSPRHVHRHKTLHQICAKREKPNYLQDTLYPMLFQPRSQGLHKRQEKGRHWKRGSAWYLTCHKTNHL